MATDFDPAAILAILNAHDVRFIVIGGFAALAHGSPFPTQDIDITPKADADNWTRLSEALIELRARVRVEGIPDGLPFSHDAHSLSGVTVWNLVTEYGDLDISVTPTGTQGYADLARDAVQVRYGDLTLHIASLADVVRSKQAANRLKDQRVLPTLRELLSRQDD